MAIKKIKIGSTEHELQTTIANVTDLQSTLDSKAASSHNHAASNITSGTLSSDRLPTVPIAKGGTGATTAAAALTNLGITATATELNYVDGVTSNIQTQLNGKASSSHTHSYLPLSGGNLTGVLGVGNKYELSPVYNYTNGCLINIAASKASTMVAIHITGNSYDSSGLPINSLFQFYDYGDGSIIQYSGVNLGLSLGAMTVYRYDGRLYAHIAQTKTYQTLAFTIVTNKSGLSPTVTNAAAHTSGYTDLVTITPENVATVSHTHTVSHTPAGTVSKPTFTGSAVTSGVPSGKTSIYSITGVGSAPSLSASVANKCLTLTFSAGSVPTRTNVSVASAEHTHSVTASGSVSQPTFTGTAATLTTSSTK